MDNILNLHSGKLTLSIDASEGMNVRSINFDGKELIICDEERKKAGGTYAIPVLFPTPNRTDDLKYSYGKREIPAVMHGFLRHETFTIDSNTGDKATGHFDFDGSNELFPYQGRMSLEIGIRGNSVYWYFNFENKSKEALAYNLALHPFFTKEGLESINVGVAEEMLNEPTLIPTGETRKVDHISLKTDEVAMDTVFLMDYPFDAEMHYDAFDMKFVASDDFKHAVVYSFPDRKFICIEPQTGSTDAHNLHAKGFRREAALIEVMPGENHVSWFGLEFVK